MHGSAAVRVDSIECGTGWAAVRTAGAVLIIGAVLSTSLGCESRAATPTTPPRLLLRITTGSGGAVPLISQALGQEYARAVPGLEVQLVTVDTSPRTIEALQNGEADVGVVLADGAYFAATVKKTSRSFQQLRAISLLPPGPLSLLGRANSGIRDVTDLRGRTVALPLVHAGSALIADLVLKTFGVAPETIRRRVLSSNDALAAVAQGAVDAALVGEYHPTPTMYSAIARGARLLSIDGPAVDRLRHEYPFVRVVRVPSNVYPGQTEIINTIGVDMLIVCRSDLAEGLVYELTAQFFDALPRLSSTVPSLRRFDPDQAPASPIPLHEGAARYYRERELFR